MRTGGCGSGGGNGVTVYEEIKTRDEPFRVKGKLKGNSAVCKDTRYTGNLVVIFRSDGDVGLIILKSTVLRDKIIPKGLQFLLRQFFFQIIVKELIKCSNIAVGQRLDGCHWDLVYIQTPEYGGGEIYFDDVLIRKDGMFVLDGGFYDFAILKGEANIFISKALKYRRRVVGDDAVCRIPYRLGQYCRILRYSPCAAAASQCHDQRRAQ